jgi:hypothetical protein
MFLVSAALFRASHLGMYIVRTVALHRPRIVTAPHLMVWS